MSPVDMVHIHHEGGGAPCTAAQCERFRHGGYCYGIGTDTFVRWLAPEDNYATADWNHRDWTPCFSGDRHTNAPITDHDLVVLHEAFMDAYNRGEVTANPQVVAHRNAGGSNATACPGDLCIDRWDEVVNACRAGGGPPEPKPEVEKLIQSATELNEDGRPELFALMTDGTIWHTWREQGGRWEEPWVKFANGPFDGGLSVWRNQNGTLELAAHHAINGFLHRWQTAPNNGWSDWKDYL